MFPTITGGDDFAKRLASKIANDVEQGVEIARRGSNDESGRVYQATLDRIISKYNAHDRAVQKAANENSMNAQKAYNETMKRILDRHNDHTYSRGFLKRRSPYNDNSTDRTDDTIMYPISPITSKGAYEQTMDRIMDRHNANGVEFNGYANDEDWSRWQDKWTSKYFPKMKGDWSDLPEYANDSQWKKKRIIHPYKPGVAQADRDELLLTDEVMDDGRIQKRRRRRKKTAARLLSEDDTMDNVSPSELAPMIDNIDSNIQQMTESVEIIRDRIIDLTDEMGVDSLKGQERDIEDNHGYNHAGQEKGSSMAPEGKNNGKSQTPEGFWSKIAKSAVGLGVLGTGAGAVIGGEAMGGETPVSDGGGYTGNKTNKPTPKEEQPKRAPSASGEDTRPKSMRADKAGNGVGYVSASAIPTVVRGDKEFQAEVTRVAKKYNMSEDDLYRVMAFETGGSFSPGQRNKQSSATGLIQFMTKGKTWATQHFGMQGEALRQKLSTMSRAEQMKVVDDYFRDNGLGRVQNPSLGDAYMTVYKPAAVGRGGDYVHARRGSKEYRTNRGFDVNKDGLFTTDEALTVLTNKDVKGVGKYKAPTRGAAVNQQSAQQGASNGVNVTVNNNTQNNVGSTATQNKEQKKTPPPARGHWWSDFYGKYFAPSI